MYSAILLEINLFHMLSDICSVIPHKTGHLVLIFCPITELMSEQNVKRRIFLELTELMSVSSLTTD